MDIPRHLIPPAPPREFDSGETFDVYWKREAPRWADYWGGCLNRGETLIPTPYGFCRDYSHRTEYAWGALFTGLVIGLLVGLVFAGIVVFDRPSTRPPANTLQHAIEDVDRTHFGDGI